MSDPTPDLDQAGDAVDDPVLRRALQNAPDQAAAPDWRIGESIRTLAHEAVAPSLPEGLVGAQRPWWQRFLGIGAGGGRLPRNAAFATVLLGVLVTATWRPQEIPGVRPDSDRPAARAAPAAPAAAVAPAPSPAASEPTPQAPAPESATAFTPVPTALDAALAESRAAAEAAEREIERQEQALQRQAERVRQAESEAAAALARLQGRPPPSAFTPLPPPRAPVAAMPAAGASPGPTGLADASGAALPRPLRAPEGEGALAKRAGAAGVGAAAPAGPGAARAEGGAAPTFSALSQWTRLSISRAGGDSRSLARGEARDLGALVGSAALAGVGAQAPSGSADWRIALERNGEVLAVLELAGGQVRWRENGAAPGIGSPGAGALAALREALEEASAAPPAGPSAPSAPAAPAR